MSLVTHRGGCHCGAVAFEVDAPARLTVSDVKSFYVPRSNPDGYSVNARCLEPATIEHIEVEIFDDNDRAASEARIRDRSRV